MIDSWSKKNYDFIVHPLYHIDLDDFFYDFLHKQIEEERSKIFSLPNSIQYRYTSYCMSSSFDFLGSNTQIMYDFTILDAVHIFSTSPNLILGRFTKQINAGVLNSIASSFNLLMANMVSVVDLPLLNRYCSSLFFICFFILQNLWIVSWLNVSVVFGPRFPSLLKYGNCEASALSSQHQQRIWNIVFLVF